MAQIVVIGLGRFGFHVARELHAQGHEVLAIDNDPDVVQRIRNHASRVVVLDARDTERLDALDLGSFDAAVVSLGERVDVSSLVAMHLLERKVPRLVTKAGSEDHGRLLHRIGVHEVIFPEREAAERLAIRLSRANLLEHLELGEDYSVEELAPSEQMVGKTLAELELPSRFDVQVLGTRDALTGKIHVNPGAAYRIRDSDSLLVLGANQQLRRLRKL